MRSSSCIFFFCKVEAASKLRCEVCPYKKFTSLKMYDDHMASKKHLKKKRKKETTDAWVCRACDLTLSSQKEWVRTVSQQLCNQKKKMKWCCSSLSKTGSVDNAIQDFLLA